jgi:hypothetical protein
MGFVVGPRPKCRDAIGSVAGVPSAMARRSAMASFRVFRKRKPAAKAAGIRIRQTMGAFAEISKRKNLAAARLQVQYATLELPKCGTQSSTKSYGIPDVGPSRKARYINYLREIFCESNIVK